MAESLPRLKAALDHHPANRVERFQRELRPWLGALQRYVRRELAYLRARGVGAGNFPTADDIVDEALVRVFRELQQRPDAPLTKAALYRAAHAALADEARRARREPRPLVSLEKAVPKAVSTGESLDESVYDFWQPDELLKVEDLVPLDSETPEEAVDREEQRRIVAQVLAELPDRWRRAVLLTQGEDMPRAEVAKQLGISEEELDRWLQHADAFLRARLQEFGFGPPRASQGRMLAASTAPPADRLAHTFDRVCGDASAVHR